MSRTVLLRIINGWAKSSLDPALSLKRASASKVQFRVLLQLNSKKQPKVQRLRAAAY